MTDEQKKQKINEQVFNDGLFVLEEIDDSKKKPKSKSQDK